MDRIKNESVLTSNMKNVERILELNNGKKLSKKDKLRLHLLKGYLLTGVDNDRELQRVLLS